MENVFFFRYFSSIEGSKYNEKSENSRSERLTSSSYKDYIVPMSKKEMPKVNNSNIALGTKFLVQ